MADLIDRQAAINGKITVHRANGVEIYSDDVVPVTYLEKLPTIEAESVTHCKDCLFGHRHDEVINGYKDTWIECISPDGMNRDVSINGYCSAGVRKND